MLIRGLCQDTAIEQSRAKVKGMHRRERRKCYVTDLRYSVRSNKTNGGAKRLAEGQKPPRPKTEDGRVRV